MLAHPSEILDRVREVYATCRTYWDRGTTTLRGEMEAGSPIEVRRTPFETAFVRPDRFRFDWTEAVAGPGSEGVSLHILWNAGSASIKSLPVGRLYSPHEAIVALSFVDGGSAIYVPALLRACRPLDDRLPPADSATLTRMEWVARQECFVIQSKGDDGDETLWIGREDFLIRRRDLGRVLDKGMLTRMRLV